MMKICRQTSTYSLGATLLLTTSLLILPNCARYSPTQIPHPAGQRQEENEVQVVTKKLSKDECQTCFDSKYLRTKYDAIQIYVKNKSTTPVVLSAANIDLPIQSSRNVSNKIRKHRTSGPDSPKGKKTLSWLSSLFSYVHSYKTSDEIEKDVSVKVLGRNESEIIQPHESVNKVIFIRKRGFFQKRKKRNQFRIKLVNEDGSQHSVFYCNLQ